MDPEVTISNLKHKQEESKTLQMKKLILLSLNLLLFGQLIAQQDKQFTNYRFDKISFNPAATGFNGYCGTLIYRNQWDRIQDAPNTTLFNVQGNFPNQNLGLGISFSNDAIGFQRNNLAYLNAAYHLKTAEGVLSGGLGVGILNVAFSPIWIPPQTIIDASIPAPTSGTGFDVNAGLYWHSTTLPYYIGLSMTHVAPQTLTAINYSTARHYYVLAGYDHRLNLNRRVDLKPSVLIKADGSTATFDLNLLSDIWLDNSKFIWGSFSYRMQDAIAIGVGYGFSPSNDLSNNVFKIGYSFDIMTNPLNTYGRGTHELILNFCLFRDPPVVARHGTPIFLD